MAHHATSAFVGSVRMERGWAVLAPSFNSLRRSREFATTGRQHARLREGVSTSGRFATLKGCHRELAGAAGGTFGTRPADARLNEAKSLVQESRPKCHGSAVCDLRWQDSHFVRFVHLLPRPFPSGPRVPRCFLPTAPWRLPARRRPRRVRRAECSVSQLDASRSRSNYRRGVADCIVDLSKITYLCFGLTTAWAARHLWP